jgi:hypothetical protein
VKQDQVNHQNEKLPLEFPCAKHIAVHQLISSLAKALIQIQVS